MGPQICQTKTTYTKTLTFIKFFTIFFAEGWKFQDHNVASGMKS